MKTDYDLMIDASFLNAKSGLIMKKPDSRSLHRSVVCPYDLDDYWGAPTCSEGPREM